MMRFRNVLASLLVLTVGLTAISAADDEDFASRIAATASDREPGFIETRRWFHQHPELSNREYGTAAEIARRLRAMGYDPRTGIAGTGVVSVGTFHAGNRFNIIAGEAVLTGTVRTLDQETWKEVPGHIERVVAGVCQAFRAGYVLDYERINPVVWNEPGLAAFTVASLRRSLGAENVREVQPIMAAEDFAYYQKEIPGVYLHLGVGNEAEGWTDYVHTPTFRPDEAAILVGVKAAATLLVDFLNEGLPAR